MPPARSRLPLVALLAAASLAAFGAASPARGQGAPSPLAPLAVPVDVGHLDQAADEVGGACAAAGLPVAEVAEAARRMVTNLLVARRMSPRAIEEISSHVVSRILAAAPPEAPLAIGPLRLERAAALQVLGSRPGRDRFAVLGRLRGAVPAQANSLSDDELLALLPALAAAAEPSRPPEALLAPIRIALSPEADQ